MSEEDWLNDMDPDTKAVFATMTKMAAHCKAKHLPADQFMPLISGFFNAWNLGQMMDDLGHQKLVAVAYSAAYDEEPPECLVQFAEDFFIKLADEYVRATAENLEEFNVETRRRK